MGFSRKGIRGQRGSTTTEYSVTAALLALALTLSVHEMSIAVSMTYYDASAAIADVRTSPVMGGGGSGNQRATGANPGTNPGRGGGTTEERDGVERESPVPTGSQDGSSQQADSVTSNPNSPSGDTYY